MFCFLNFQDIREEPKKTQKPVMEPQEYGQQAQSESAKPKRCIGAEAEKKSPCAGADLRYLRTRVAALK